MQNHSLPPTPGFRSGRKCSGRTGIAAAVFIVLLLLVGCTTETKHKWLSRFFDGVPACSATNAPSAAVEEGVSVTNATVSVAAQPAQPLIPHSLHPPYHDGNCTECHESKFSQKMKGPMNTVCFSCHDDFLAKAKIKHQPADTGDCRSCHDPHESLNKKLLLRTGKAMCLECHDDPLAQGKVRHQAVESGDCLDCHNPHASDVKGLLKKPLAPSCFECHDDFLKTARFKHAPAENGECSSCHAPHQSNFKALLTKSDPQICFDCHEQTDVTKVEAHKKADLTTCLGCHDPHASAVAKLLKPGPGKLKEPK